jgi:hypothetical protein
MVARLLQRKRCYPNGVRALRKLITWFGNYTCCIVRDPAIQQGTNKEVLWALRITTTLAALDGGRRVLDLG